MGFQLTRQQPKQTSTAATADFLEETFDGGDEVWRGDSGDIVISDQTDFDEDDATQYVLIGTVASYVQELRELVAAR
jgi:hypothetical protein